MIEIVFVSGIMYLVADMATDAKRAMREKKLGLSSLLLYLTDFLIIIIPEMCRFEYSEIRHEDCEGMLGFSRLIESRVSASRLTSLGFYTLLKCLNWLICTS